MIPDPNSLTVAGALVLLVGAVIRALYARVERNEQRTDRRMTYLEEQQSNQQKQIVALTDRTGNLSGQLKIRERCGSTECPFRDLLPKPDSDPSNQSIYKTPRIPAKP